MHDTDRKTDLPGIESKNRNYEISSKSMRKIKKIKNLQSCFEVIKDLGKGSFGTVVQAKNRTTGIVNAIKIISKSKMNAS